MCGFKRKGFSVARRGQVLSSISLSGRPKSALLMICKWFDYILQKKLDIREGQVSRILYSMIKGLDFTEWITSCKIRGIEEVRPYNYRTLKHA